MKSESNENKPTQKLGTISKVSHIDEYNKANPFIRVGNKVTTYDGIRGTIIEESRDVFVVSFESPPKVGERVYYLDNCKNSSRCCDSDDLSRYLSYVNWIKEYYNEL